MTLDYFSKIIELVSKFILAPLFGFIWYFWNKHVKQNEKDLKEIKANEELQKKEVERIRKQIAEYREKQNKEIHEKMSDDKNEIIAEIKEYGKHINTLCDKFNEYKRITDSRLTRVETKVGV